MQTELKNHPEPTVLPGLVERHPHLTILYQDSLTGTFLFGEKDTGLRHIANHGFNPPYKNHPRIACALGLQLVDSETQNGVAVCSYDLVTYEELVVMKVCHTPQGKAPGKGQFALSHNERQRLLSCNFRDYMMQGLIFIAEDNHIPAIQVVAAINHPKVRAEEVSLERGCDIIDEVALARGFTYGSDFNLWLRV